MLCTRSSIVAVAICALSVIVHVAYADVRHIDNSSLAALQKQGVPLVDVRTPEEWFTTGILPNSLLLTFFDEQGKYDIDRWIDNLGDFIDYQQPFILICDVGVRTEAISRVLSNHLKLPLVYNVKEGIQAWLDAGHETEPPPYLINLPDQSEEQTP